MKLHSKQTNATVIKQPRLNLVRTIAASVLLGLFLTGCFPKAPEDDESNASFAREVIPTLLGRRATGVDEVEVVADIAQLLGREAAIRMLMEEEDYVDHWADAMVDILKLQRHANNDGVNAAQDAACWGPPTTDDPDPAIAAWVRDHGPQDAGAPTGWNMTDLLRSAIAIDDLSVIYKSYLFPLAIRRDSFAVDQDQLTERLLTVYLNRDTTCLRCHNPTFSTSNVTDAGGNMLWQRLFTFPGHPEKALFGNYYDSVAAFDNITQLMRSSVRQPAPVTGILPWGMDLSCATDTDQAGANNNGTAVFTGFQTVVGGGTSVSFGSLDGSVDPNVSLWDLERALNTGIQDLQDGYERFTATSVVLPPDEQNYCDAVDVFAANCTGCHSGGAPSGGMDLSVDPHAELVGVATQAGGSVHPTRVVVNNTATSELWSRVDSAAAGYQMPPGGGLGASEKSSIENWINSGAVGIDIENCNTSSIPDVAPDEAFAFLTAANAVDGIWDAVMGYRLTIDHGFSRNKEQRDMLWNLTEYTFLPEDWSLKAVLSKMLASDWFARRAPSLTQLNSAYPLHPILDPWIVANPVDVPNPSSIQEHNGKGEQVNRYRVNTILRSIADALGWQEPRRFRDASYPTNVDENLGQFRSPTIAGFDDVNFQSLLALESEVGLCVKSGKSVNADDWIDLLVTEISNFNAGNPAAPITIGDAYSLLKDRLLQDTTIQYELPQDVQGVAGALTEEAAIVALFDAGTAAAVTLNSSSDALSANELGSKLRESCGALVKTPQFLLANITPRGYSDNNMPDEPRLDVCLDGQSCGYTDACGHWRSTLWDMGDYIACEDRTVREAQLFFYPWPGDFTFRPREPGPFTPIWDNKLLWPIEKSNPATLKFDRSQVPDGILKQAEFDLQYKHRTATICPAGQCGFVNKPSVQQCLEKPDSTSCRRLIANCDPRDRDQAGYCGTASTDVRSTGVHVLWADGAVVSEVSRVRILRPQTKGSDDANRRPKRDNKLTKGDQVELAPSVEELTTVRPEISAIKGRKSIDKKRKRVGSGYSRRDLTKLQKRAVGPLSGSDLRWRYLERGERLQAGDIVDIPLSGQLTLKYKHSVLTTGKPIKGESKGRINRHVLSITGPSTTRLLNQPLKRGALSVAQLRDGVLKGNYESRGVDKKQFERIKRLSVQPESIYLPSMEELQKQTQNFDGQHIIGDPDFTPEGTDRRRKSDK